jgi:hypothetical protein
MATGTIITEECLLWTNPSSFPTGGWAAQTVTLDLSPYRFVRIVFAPFDDLGQQAVTECPVGAGSALFYMQFDTGHTSSASTFINGTARNFSVTTSGIQFQAGQMVYNGGAYKDWNNRAVPYKIYGIK